MSLAIDVDALEAVMLPDWAWHVVEPGSFTLEPYEFGGQNERGRWYSLVKVGAPGLSPLGASWREKESGKVITCPLSSIVAFREKERVASPAVDEVPEEAEV